MQKRFKGERENGRYAVRVLHRNGGWTKRFDDLESAKECATKVSPTYKWDAWIEVVDLARGHLCLNHLLPVYLFTIDHKQANGFSNELEDISYWYDGKDIIEVTL